MKVRDESARGKCYEKAFALLKGDRVLCHGVPTLAREPRVRFGHAWVEEVLFDVSFVIDPLFPKSHILRSTYYEVGKIDECEVVRYSREEAQRHYFQTETYGPWAEHVAMAAHSEDVK